MSPLDTLDQNTLLFEVLSFVDCSTTLSFGSTNSRYYKMIFESEGFWDYKMKQIDDVVTRALIPNLEIYSKRNSNQFVTTEPQDPETIEQQIIQQFSNAYDHFRKMMFQVPPPTSKESFLDFFSKRPKKPQFQIPPRTLSLILQYVKFNACSFVGVQPGQVVGHTSIEHLNKSYRSTTASGFWRSTTASGFWETHALNCCMKVGHTYAFSFLLTKYDKSNSSNSWCILLGYQEDQEPTQSWLKTGYCIKSDAEVANGTTSYTPSSANLEGDMIGIIFDRYKHQMIVWNGENKKHIFSMPTIGDFYPCVSLVNIEQMVSVFPWDKDPKSLFKRSERNV